jgi:hypothetical protein
MRQFAKGSKPIRLGQREILRIRCREKGLTFSYRKKRWYRAPAQNFSAD